MLQQGKKFLQLMNNKKIFLLGVLGNLIAQLGITYWTMMNYKGLAQVHFWLYVVFQFIIIFALASFSLPTFIKLILFSLFSFVWGILFAFYRNDPFYSKMIQFSIAGTASIFGAMFFIGILLIIFGVKLGLQASFFLFFSLLFLIILQVVSLFTTNHSRWISGFSIVLFSLYIIYDTNTILQRDYRGDIITASLDYYLDAINIFSSLFEKGF